MVTLPRPVTPRYRNGLGAASGFTGSWMTRVSTGTFEVFVPVSATVSGVPGIAGAPAGSMSLVVVAFSVGGTVGVTVASSCFGSALSASMLAVLTSGWPLADTGMSSLTMTGTVMVTMLPGARPT